ncbi:TetR/AcrR family transcriptional regulator [Altererythrobacter sp. MF3-039]|uniref:TetR/AcrR family transcriptional regulator n=1 Tax=Altererythrobacter sp. MF3-039 TaxID=3252901 RepID=UPI00390C8342
MATVLELNTKAETTRARILESAATLFWQRSYHGVAIDEVAARCGVNKATIYRYYLDKSELALAAIVHNGEAVIRDIFEPAMAFEGHGDDRLAFIYHRIYCAHVSYLKREGDIHGCPIAGMALELGQDMPKVRAEAHRIFSRIGASMARIAECEARPDRVDLLAPAQLAPALVQLMHGAFTSARLEVSPAPVLDAGNASLALWGSEVRLTDQITKDPQ